MNPNRLEVAAAILAKCAAFDNRKPDQSMAAAWAEALDVDITAAEGFAIVTRYYAENREWIMPADVNRIARAVREKRRQELDRHILIPEGLEDEPHLENAWRTHVRRAVGAGLTLDEAKARAWQAIKRTPPQVETAPRAVLLPRLRQP